MPTDTPDQSPDDDDDNGDAELNLWSALSDQYRLNHQQAARAKKEAAAAADALKAAQSMPEGGADSQS
jgi:hypothetical protein